jgi:DNA-binding transcriptional MerR regulator
MENQNNTLLTIGELAGKAGVSVRTLQYYDRLGLLRSTHSEGGRRTYARGDIFKLQQILFLKSFGFSLDEIKEKILKRQSASDLEAIFTEQRGLLSAEIENLNRIRDMLDTLIFETKRGKDVSLDKLMTIMYLMRQGNPYALC